MTKKYLNISPDMGFIRSIDVLVYNLKKHERDHLNQIPLFRTTSPDILNKRNNSTESLNASFLKINESYSTQFHASNINMIKQDPRDIHSTQHTINTDLLLNFNQNTSPLNLMDMPVPPNEQQINFTSGVLENIMHDKRLPMLNCDIKPFRRLQVNNASNISNSNNSDVSNLRDQIESLKKVVMNMKLERTLSNNNRFKNMDMRDISMIVNKICNYDFQYSKLNFLTIYSSIYITMYIHIIIIIRVRLILINCKGL